MSNSNENQLNSNENQLNSTDIEHRDELYFFSDSDNE